MYLQINESVVGETHETQEARKKSLRHYSMVCSGFRSGNTAVLAGCCPRGANAAISIGVMGSDGFIFA